MKLGSWGRLSYRDYTVKILGRDMPAEDEKNASTSAIVRGSGLSYGDCCLNGNGVTYLTQKLDRFIEFDSSRGLLTCEAGVTLGEIQSSFASKGWMLPVTPGTQFVTVGGAIANDVHGKNHHRYGCFGNHVTEIKLARTDGHTFACSPTRESNWFAATVGGLGLTGVIREATIQLRPVLSRWLDIEALPYSSLEEFFAITSISEENWEYTVSWLDCSKAKRPRGIFFRANHSEIDTDDYAGRSSWSIPVTPPISPVNRYSLAIFNSLYYAMHRKRSGAYRDHYTQYFYPLDSITHWNRLYGRKGFYQYQLVIPLKDSETVLQSLLREIARSGMGSFLSVLKTFGERESLGMLSFPMAGVTMALDFPNRGKDLERLFKRLDAIVLDAGGRLYPAKDARMPAKVFAAGYSELPQFLQYKDPGLSSDLSRRLMGF